MILNHLWVKGEFTSTYSYVIEDAVRIDSVLRDHENCTGSYTDSEVELTSYYGLKAVADLSIIAGERRAQQ